MQWLRGKLSELAHEEADAKRSGLGSVMALASTPQPDLYSPPRQQRSRIVPVGGSWPHVGGPFTDGERTAAFVMAFREGWAYGELATLVGLDEAELVDLIGTTADPGRWVPPPSGWEPSSELLAFCGLQIQRRVQRQTARVVQLHGQDRSRRVRDETGAAAELAAVKAKCGPPGGFVRGGRWRDCDLQKLLSDYEALMLVCGKAEAASVVLHEVWGYAKSDKGSGALGKKLTEARSRKSTVGARNGTVGKR